MRSGIPGKPRSTRGHRLVWMACLVLLAACSSLSRQPKNDALNEARHLWRDTAAIHRQDLAARNWLHCAVVAYQASESGSAAQQAEAQTLADNCTHELLGYLLDVKPDPWRSQSLRVLDVPLRVEFRDLPDSLDDGPVALARADEVTIPPVMGERFATPGYGVPMVGWQKRCNDKPICMLYPPEGITRSLTAWWSLALTVLRS